MEICNNGIDDNCDGLIDCADPYCTSNPGGWACTSLPNSGGWSINAYDSTGRPACPSDFGNGSFDVISSIGGAADSCQCECSIHDKAYCEGTWKWNASSTTTCPSPIGGLDIKEGYCTANAGDNLNPSLNFAGAASSVSTVAGTCDASGDVTNTPAVTYKSGEACYLGTAGSGCSSGEVCAPAAPTGYLLCSIIGNATSCPAGTSEPVFTGYHDGRGCGTCTCSGTSALGCTLEGVDFWPTATCGSGTGCYMDTTCKNCFASGTGDVNAADGKWTTNGDESTCTVNGSGSQPTGSVTGTGSVTLRCQ